MSNYHVLQTQKADRALIAFHISVPDEDNDIGKNLQTIVMQSISQEISLTQVPWLETDFASEYTQISNGEIYEHVISVQYDGNLSNAAKLSIMDAKYTSLIPIIQNEIRNRFKFWGLNRNVT